MATPPVLLKPIVPKGKITQANRAQVLALMGILGFRVQRGAATYPASRTSYRRTGKLGRSWTKKGPYSSGHDLVVEIGNNVVYTRYVQGLRGGEFSQRQLFASLGWRSVEDIADDEIRKLLPALEKALH